MSNIGLIVFYFQCQCLKLFSGQKALLSKILLMFSLLITAIFPSVPHCDASAFLCKSLWHQNTRALSPLPSSEVVVGSLEKPRLRRNCGASYGTLEISLATLRHRALMPRLSIMKTLSIME